MKKNKYYLGCLLFLLLGFTFTGCEPSTEDGSYVEPITLYEKFGGSWNLLDLVVVDENPINGWNTNLATTPTQEQKAPVKSEMSMNGMMGFDSFVLKLDLSADRRPAAFSVESLVALDVFKLFPESGYWDLNLEFPTPSGEAPKILLYSDEARTDLLATVNVTSSPGATMQMEVKRTKLLGGKPYVSYVYKLKK